MKYKKGLAVFTAVTMCLGGAMTAQAEELINSTGSLAEDITIGADAVQQKATKYESINDIKSTTYNEERTVNVYATKGSEFMIKFPVDIILDGESEIPSCTYYVGVKGDLSSDQKVEIVPKESFAMEEISKTGLKKPSAKGTVSLERTCFEADEIKKDEYVTANGAVSAPITAGIWQGQIDFTVSLTNAQ